MHDDHDTSAKGMDPHRGVNDNMGDEDRSDLRIMTF